MYDTMEVVRFRLRPGSTAEEWLEAAARISVWLKTQPGFRMRSLSQTEDGEWIDMLCWESTEAACAAGERFGDDMGGACEPLIDIASISCSRGKTHLMLQR